MKHHYSLQASTKPNFKKQQGLSLIEILITVLILGVGSLGIAAMQIAGLNYSSGSYTRTQATQFAADMANRLKSNREEALDLRPDGTFGDAPPYVIDTFTNEFAGGDDCINDTCNSTELANFDKQSWLADIARALPSGQGQVTFNDTVNADGATERIYSIGIQWRQVAVSSDRDGDADDDVKNVIFRVSI